MNRGKNILKKTTVAVLSSSMILTGASTVFAAGSYQETARTSLDALVSSITAMTDDYAKSMDKAFAGSNGKMTLTVEDTGKVVLGSLLGQQDMTWLQDLTMDMKVSVKDGTEAINSTILLNGEKLCDLNVYEDLSEMKQYIQIPEVSDAYLSVDPAGSADAALPRSPAPIGRSVGTLNPKERGVNTSTMLFPTLNLRKRIVINRISTSRKPATSIPSAYPCAIISAKPTKSITPDGKIEQISARITTRNTLLSCVIYPMFALIQKK